LAGKMLILAKDRRMRQKMRKNNLEKIVKQYDQSIIMRKLDNEYSKLL
jgi:glycosyltransferase involved in cell wall biosynthesis